MGVSKHVSILAALGIVAAIGTGGCKKNDEEAQTAGYQQGGQWGQPQQPGYQQQPGYGQQPGYQQQPQQGQQPAPAAGGQQPPATGQPGATPPASGQAGGQAQAIDPAAAAAAQPILNALAQSEAPGASPVGSPIAGNFQQGQQLEQQIQLDPQKCYTVVAAGLPPISEVNLQLVFATPIPNVAPVLAEDKDTGTQAVMGRNPNCIKPLIGAPAKVVLKVAGGSGIAAAQVYAK
jgi:hypothetical protein